MLDCYERHCREDVVEADPVRRQGAGAFIRAIDRGNLRDGGEGCFLALCGKMDERASAEVVRFRNVVGLEFVVEVLYEFESIAKQRIGDVRAYRRLAGDVLKSEAEFG